MSVSPPPSGQEPQWSLDRRWWWDGLRWIPAPPPLPSRRGSHRAVWIVAGAGAMTLIVLIAAGGIVLIQGLDPFGPPHFVLQSTQGVAPCDFPSQYWNGGSGTNVEWTLPANFAPISSCSFTATFKNTGGSGSSHVTFAARYGPEYIDSQGYWHVRFIVDSSVTCLAEVPTTVPGGLALVRCSLSTPGAGEYMGRYTYALS